MVAAHYDRRHITLIVGMATLEGAPMHEPFSLQSVADECNREPGCGSAVIARHDGILRYGGFSMHAIIRFGHSSGEFLNATQRAQQQ